MNEPTGYTALDLIGFTDRGNYNPVTNYVKNDLVHYGGSIWRILIDDTVGQTPQEGIYYTFFVKEPTNMIERIMAPLEQNPATQAWAVGRQIINNDYLYEVIAPIAIGDNLVAYEDDPTNANIKLAPPIETQVLAIKNEADKTEDMIAPAESNPAAASHSVGTQIIVDNILYDVTSPIAASDALVAYPTTGYNIKPAAPVSSQIQALTNAEKDTRDSIAPTEDGTTFTHSYSRGNKFYHNGNLYEVDYVGSVGVGTAITPGTNCKLCNSIANRIPRELMVNETVNIGNQNTMVALYGWNGLQAAGKLILPSSTYFPNNGTYEVVIRNNQFTGMLLSTGESKSLISYVSGITMNHTGGTTVNFSSKPYTSTDGMLIIMGDLSIKRNS